MRDLKISSGLLLLIVAAFGNVSAMYNMTETCQYMAFGFVADPSSCQSYGYCNNSMLVGKGKCPDGYLYNPRLGICDIPANVHCVSDKTTVCANVPDMQFVADPTNCNGYCYCENNKAQCTVCPTNQVYDKVKTECVYPDSTTSKCSADSICRLVPNGVFLGDPDPNNCGKYIGCLNGVGTPGTCPEKSYFNYKIGMCQSTNPCTNPTPGTAGPGVLTPLDDDDTKCSAYSTAEKAAKTQYFADSQTCMGYYTCTSTTGPGTWSKCPKGLHFNEGKCVTPYTFKCQKDRCGNLNQKFVGAVDTACKNYLTCKNETSQGSTGVYTGTPCKPNIFFNEVTQTCDATSPATGTPEKPSKYALC